MKTDTFLWDAVAEGEEHLRRDADELDEIRARAIIEGMEGRLNLEGLLRVHARINEAIEQLKVKRMARKAKIAQIKLVGGVASIARTLGFGR